MATIREIRQHISAVRSIQKITRAMRMVAAAKLRRAQDRILKTRPYAIKLEETIARVAMGTNQDNHPLLVEYPDKQKNLLVIVSADSGLCGGFNSSIIKEAQCYIDKYHASNVDLYSIGRKGRDYFRRDSIPIVGQKITFFHQLKFTDAIETTHHLKELYLLGRYRQIDMLYNEFVSVIKQVTHVKQLFPICTQQPAYQKPSIDYLYEPDKTHVLDMLIPYYLDIQIWRILLESYAAEMSAKMTAMDMATENANDLLNTLTILYNRTRQAMITNEILEVVSGA
jgi:F-type H+-transporting ATPase subunit gamma